ncbi:MAG: hypothetical protein LBQ58_06270 [Synergistaceae bacterium]|nr:hypothetical protein [Synergistaceae bacterium]
MEGGAALYYPVNTRQNEGLYERYKTECEKLDNFYFGGRLGSYRYLDIDKTIEEALFLFENIYRRFPQ